MVRRGGGADGGEAALGWMGGWSGRSLEPLFGWWRVTYVDPTSWSVCSLGGGEGDCGVVSLNKMAARPLSTRAH